MRAATAKPNAPRAFFVAFIIDGSLKNYVRIKFAGSFMSCEYQMHTALQGAGTCMFSNGAKYKVHIGN